MPALKQWLLRHLLKASAKLSSAVESDIVRRQIAKAAVYKALSSLHKAEALSLMSEVISETVAPRANISSLQAQTRKLTEISSEVDPSSFLFLLAQAIYHYVEVKMLPAILSD